MNTTICGHDRETLKWALRVAEYQGEESAKIVCGTYAKLAFAYPDNADACGKRDALWTIVDPAKLAVAIGATLRGFGLDAQVRLLVKDGEWPDVEVLYFPNEYNPSASESIGFYIRETGRNFDCTMPAARDLALRLLQLPKGATVDDALKALEVET